MLLNAKSAEIEFFWTDYKPSALDRGYTVKAMLAHLRSVCATPLITGLPFGHVPTKVTMPFGRKVQLVIEGRDAFVGW